VCIIWDFASQSQNYSNTNIYMCADNRIEWEKGKKRKKNDCTILHGYEIFISLSLLAFSVVCRKGMLRLLNIRQHKKRIHQHQFNKAPRITAKSQKSHPFGRQIGKLCFLLGMPDMLRMPPYICTYPTDILCIHH
jgi:hypothetical protein